MIYLLCKYDMISVPLYAKRKSSAKQISLKKEKHLSECILPFTLPCVYFYYTTFNFHFFTFHYYLLLAENPEYTGNGRVKSEK